MSSLRRYDVYSMWRAACDACVVLRDSPIGPPTDAVVLGHGLLVAQIDHVRARLALQAGRVRALPGTIAPELSRVELARDQLALLATADRDEIDYAPHRVSLGSERALLDAALKLDALAGEGHPIALDELARHAALALDVARQGVCQWLDEGLVRFRHEPVRPDAEAIVIGGSALARGEAWSSYRRRRDHDERAAP